MEKILIAIIVLSVFVANAQNDSIKYVNFRLPSNAISITHSNLNLNEGKDDIIKDCVYLYRIGNFNLGVNEVFRKYYPPYFLENSKKWSINNLNQSVGLIDRLQYTSRIEKINDIKVLIREQKYENYLFYHVSVINESNTMAFNAAITFTNESGKAAATKLMYDFLNSIVFDDPKNVPCSITPSSCSSDQVFRDCGCYDKPVLRKAR